MRNLHIYLSALTVLHEACALGHGPSHFRDLQAFPKFEVQFLNHLPISESDASRCLSEGVQQEDEWFKLRDPVASRRRIDSAISSGPIAQTGRLDLIRMALAPPGADLASPYLCLMPHTNTTASQVQPVEEPETAIDPVAGWAALSHLEGKCLYTKQGWFTYSYCHNSHIRQFRAAQHAHPHPPGGHVPTEDPNQDAYTLGRVSNRKPGGTGYISGAKPRKAASPGKDTAQSDSNARADKQHFVSTPPDNSLQSLTTSSTLGSPSRYLIQKWSDGTPCDKTGRPREIEIQVHCSMSSTDRIYQIKELAVCSYVIIIHSPHICALPGFRMKMDDTQGAGVRCRKVVGDAEFEEWINARSGDESERKGIDGTDTALRPEGMGMKRVEMPLLPPTPNIVKNEGPGLRELLELAKKKKREAEQAAQVMERHQHPSDPRRRSDPNDQDRHHGQERQAFTGDDTQHDVTDHEVVLISLEEDEDGHTAFYVHSNGDDETILNAGEAGEGSGVMGIQDERRELLLKAVQDFLASESEGKGRGKKKRDTDEREDGTLERARDEL